MANDGTALATGYSQTTGEVWRVQYTPNSGAGTWGTPIAPVVPLSNIIGLTSALSPDGDGWVTLLPFNNSDGTPVQYFRCRQDGPSAGWDATATLLTGLKGSGPGGVSSNSRPRVFAGPSNHVFVLHSWYENSFGENQLGVVRLQ